MSHLNLGESQPPQASMPGKEADRFDVETSVEKEHGVAFGNLSEAPAASVNRRPDNQANVKPVQEDTRAQKIAVIPVNLGDQRGKP